jgi:hypothetical protein
MMTFKEIAKHIKTDLVSRQMALVALALLIGILVTACGGSEEPSSSGTTEEPVSDSAVSEESETSEEDEVGLEEFGMTMEKLVTTVEAVESGIAACMTENGFEYVAVDFNTVRNAMEADKSRTPLTEKEFAEQHGFGISTLNAEFEVPQLADEAYPVRIGLGEQNVQIFNNLSATDQQAYNRTLFGENTEATFAVTLEGEDFSRTGGCTRTAVEQVFTTEQLSATYLNPRDARYEEEPRMIAAVEDYVACVREKGYDYGNPDEVESDIQARFDDITEGAPIDTLSDDAKAALAELQEEERAVAVVSFDCEESTIHPVQEQLDNE